LLKYEKHNFLKPFSHAAGRMRLLGGAIMSGHSVWDSETKHQNQQWISAMSPRPARSANAQHNAKNSSVCSSDITAIIYQKSVRPKQPR
jgi:hypothetical protein